MVQLDWKLTGKVCIVNLIPNLADPIISYAS
jgi:hypothetical protein